MKKSYGVNMIVDVLRGSKNKKLLDFGFNELSTYGIMKDYSNENLKTFINTLVSHGYLELIKNIGYNGTYPTVKLNDLSTKVLKGEIHRVDEKQIPCNRINCFCMYSDYTPLTLDEWIEFDRKRRAGNTR